MSQRTRRIIMICFILVFVIGAPLLILYSSGYRYNFKKRRVIKTGLMVVRTIPKDAAVYLDNKPQDKERFQINADYTRIADLPPKDYLLEIKKDGYFGWQKNLEVKPNQTTFAEKILLFKKNTPQQIVEGKIKTLEISPNKKTLAVINTLKTVDDLLIYDIETDKSEKIAFPGQPNKIDSIAWAPSSKRLLVHGLKKDFYYNLDNREAYELQAIIEKNLHTTKVSLEKIKFHQSDNNIVYGVIDHNLYEVNIILEKIKLLESDFNISDYTIRDNALLVLDNSITNKSYLIKSNLRSLHQGKKTITLPHSDGYRFINQESSYLNLLDDQSQILYIFDYNRDDFVKPDEIISGVKNAIWFPNNDWLLYYNDFEIWILKKTENDKTLLTRISETIKQATWVAGHPYIAFIVGNEIRIIEEDGRDRRNIIKLYDLSEITRIEINHRGDKLLIDARINDMEGLFSHTLRDK